MPIHFRRNSNSLPGRILLTLFFGIFFVAGVAMAVQMLSQIAQHLQTYTWTQSDCQVQHSALVDDNRLDIQYSFLVDGRRYVGSTVTPGITRYDSVAEVQKMAALYPQGATVSCFYDSASPDQSLLIRRSPFFPFAILFPFIFILIGAGLGYLVWFGKTRSEAEAETELKPLSRRRSSENSGQWLIIIFFGVFALLGGGMTYVTLVRPSVSVFQAQSWPEVDCTVISSEVRHHSGDSTTYSPNIVYRYVRDGREYRSDRFDFLGGSSSGHASKAQIVAAYPPGHPFRCFVDPADPTEAVIERGFTSQMWVGLVPLVFFLIGIGGIIYGRKLVSGTASGSKGSLSAEKHKSFSQFGDASKNLGATPRFAPVSETAPQPVKVSASRSTQLMVVSFIALVWNGIVSIFVVQAVTDFEKEGWFLVLFLIPFVLVGAGLIAGVFYTFLKLFQPSIVITVSPNQPKLGGRMTVKWELAGRTHWLKDIRIEVDAREEATYRRGTDTHTDSSVFFQKEIFSATFSQSLLRGEAHFEFPFNTMHTFNGANNKIIWTLRIKGSIDRFPDLSEELTFTVLPSQGVKRHDQN